MSISKRSLILATTTAGLVTIVHLIASCASVEKVPEVAPTPEMARLSKHSLTDLNAGYAVFKQNCFKCHDQPGAETYASEDWKSVVASMSEHAGITKKEGKLVSKYIVARSLIEGE